MTTVEDVAVAALTRLGELGIPVSGTRSVLYRRASIRQQQLFSAAAKQNPEYFGEVALGTLINGALDINAMVPSGVPDCEAVYRIEVGDKGTSTYTNGDRVSVVSVNDAATVALPPRVTMQNRVLRAVDTDLVNVAKLKVYYSRRPAVMDAATDPVELPAPFEELLVLDLAIWLTKGADSPEPRKQTLLTVLSGEEKDLLASFAGHLTSFTAAFEGRFGALR